MKLRVLSLFAGIGGFDLGLERTGGFETVAFCEIDPFCQRVLAKHWPGVPCYDDVRTLTADRLAADGIIIDVICGGFPCQDISVAGEGAGLDGERSGLWSEIVRLSSELRPKFIIVENVSALLDRGLGRVLGDVAAIGYDAEWHCIPASAVGAPHRRDRFWLIAQPDSVGWEFGAELAGRLFARPLLWESFGAADSTRLKELADFCRAIDGLPDQVDSRLKAIGNAVVPQIPELIGRAILASLKAESIAA